MIEGHDSSGWQYRGIKQMDVVYLAGGDGYEDRNCAAKVDNRARLDGGLGETKIDLREQAKTQMFMRVFVYDLFSDS